MKIWKIQAVILTLIFTFNTTAAEYVFTETPQYTPIQTKNGKEKSVVLEYTFTAEEKLPEDNLYNLPVFQPYYLSKNEMVFNSAKNKTDAIDPMPSASYFPGARGTNQLIIYTPFYGTRTNTNEYGAEAVVVGNTVTELSGADSFIPENGIVISGHGRAKDWIISNIKAGTKIYIDRSANMIYAYTTSDSYIFETEKKIHEAELMTTYYRENYQDYNWKVPASYINDAKEFLKKARKNPEEVQKYSQLAIDAANDALKSVLPYEYGELKGVWVRPTEKTEEEIVAAVQRIKDTGIDNIFLETYFHGKTVYPSRVMKDYGFEEQNIIFKGFDPLCIWIREAHKRNMKVHIWFETFYVGNSNPNDNPYDILALNPSWGNKTGRDFDSLMPSKSPSEHNGYFLDPANPLVQDFVLKLVDEINKKYKPDGINLDYIRYPQSVSLTPNGSWGYTNYARREFQSLYGIDPIEISTASPMWTLWCAYRRGKVTQTVKKIGDYCKQNKLYVSTVIFPDRLSALNTKHQDWKNWSYNNYINGFTPLFLTCDSKTANAMMQDVIRAKSPNTDLYAGLFVAFMGGAEEDLIRQIHEARKLETNGVIIFDYAHLNNRYAKTLAASVFSTKSAAIRIQRPLTVEIKPQQGIAGKKKKNRFWRRKR